MAPCPQRSTSGRNIDAVPSPTRAKMPTPQRSTTQRKNGPSTGWDETGWDGTEKPPAVAAGSARAHVPCCSAHRAEPAAVSAVALAASAAASR